MAPEPLKKPSPARQLLFGGILPIVVYTLVEETLGILWGLVAGMVIGLIEMSYEWHTQKKLSGVTLGATILIVGLGAISLFTQEGVWFKLQPAIMEAAMSLTLIITWILGKPLLLLMAEKQGVFAEMDPKLIPILRRRFGGLNLRIGIFFAAHAVLAVFAALYWSTRAWALLKGVGFTASMILYLVVEIVFLRMRLKRELKV